MVTERVEGQEKLEVDSNQGFTRPWTGVGVPKEAAKDRLVLWNCDAQCVGGTWTD